jgi:hypothetical protein
MLSMHARPESSRFFVGDFCAKGALPVDGSMPHRSKNCCNAKNLLFEAPEMS